MFNRIKKLAARLFAKSGFAVGLRAAMSQGNPGAWASDHREETNQFTGWNYIAIRAIAQQVAQATVSIYSDGGDPRKARLMKTRRRYLRNIGISKAHYVAEEMEQSELPPDHPYVMLHKRPNPAQSGASFRYEQALQLSLTGTCLVWKVSNRLGKTVERYVIPTAIAQPIAPSSQYPRGAYRISAEGHRFFGKGFDDGFVETMGFARALGTIIPADQMLVIRWPHPLWKDDGYSPVSAGALQVDTANQIDQARWSHLRNGPDPSLFITPGEGSGVNEQELDRASIKFNEKYGGVGNTGKAIFGSPETKITPLSTTPKDMSYGEGFLQYRDFILALHGTPPVAAGITEGGTYAAFYASLKQFTSLAVQPILELLAEEDTEQQGHEFGSGLTVEFDAQSIDDPELLERRIQTDTAAGAIRRGEIRGLRGMEPFGDDRDDEIAGPREFAEQLPAGFSDFTEQSVAVPDESSTGITGFPSASQVVSGNGKSRLNGKWFDRVARRALKGVGK